MSPALRRRRRQRHFNNAMAGLAMAGIAIAGLAIAGLAISDLAIVGFLRFLWGFLG